MTDRHPSFIYRGGDMMAPPPFELRKSRFYGFFVQGDINKMQATVDRELNAVGGKDFRLKVISDHVMLACADLTNVYPTPPEYRKKGFIKELDICFWIPVGRVTVEDGKERVHEIFWYCDYIWVDSPITMVAGRDIYGYPKTMGIFDFPDASAPDHFSLKVNSFKDYAPETEALWNKVLSVDNLTPGGGPVSRWTSYVDALKGIWDVLDDGLFHPDLHATEQMLSLLLKPELPQIFLKQFPDASAEKAVYQSLVSLPAVIDRFEAGGLLSGEYQLTLEQVDGIPLVEDLGLKIGPQALTLGIWMDYDFTLPVGKVLVENTYIPPKEKIAVLGGGVSSCVSAFALTSQPGWQDRYDITVYQQGWRIGGKGASGRNAELGQRIEEHGLHVWMGFYENAFKVMREAYSELNRPAGAPLATWEDAFKKQDFVVHMEKIAGEWEPWTFDFPQTDDVPGDGDEVMDTWQFMEIMYGWLKKFVGDLSEEIEKIEEGRIHSRPHGNFLDRIAGLAERIEEEVEDAVEDVWRLVNGLTQFVGSLPKTLAEHKDSDHSFLDHILDDLKEWLEDIVEGYLDEHDNLRHLYVGLDLAMAVLTGMHRDKIHKLGFDVINDLDLRTWLRQNGANEHYTVHSAPITAMYDLVFAYKDGDITQPSLEAGTGLRGMLLLVLGYKGAVMWKMQAGMGDTVFTPFYQVLKQRGVKFKYFHQVESLSLDPNNSASVEKINLLQQAELAGGADHYDPLVYVKGLACWPSEPHYGQLLPETAQLLQANNIDLECFWTDWPEVYRNHYQRDLPKVNLQRGKDFDKIIYGISVASLPHICSELLANSPVLQATSDKLNTVATQAYQLWNTEDLRDLGWDHYPPSGQEPILTAFTEPVDTWAAMNQLLAREEWEGYPTEPKNCAYFCGVQPIESFPPPSEHGFPAAARAQVKENCINQLNQDIKALWTNSASNNAFHWSLLYDTEDRQGEARFDAQYWRSNVSPSERYVLSTVGTSQFRIEPKVDDFDNVFFTGDWINNGINAGCVEAATIGGLKTSRAISGLPKTIAGEGVLWG